MDKLNSKDNLEIQLKKTAKSTNEGSYGTRDRYLEGAKRAYRYIVEKYNPQKIQNLRGKHLHDLVDHMKAKVMHLLRSERICQASGLCIKRQAEQTDCPQTRSWAYQKVREGQ